MNINRFSHLLEEDLEPTIDADWLRSFWDDTPLAGWSQDDITKWVHDLPSKPEPTSQEEPS